MQEVSKVEATVIGLEEFQKALTKLESAVKEINEVRITLEVITPKTSSFTREEIEEIVREMPATATIDYESIRKSVIDQLVKLV
jgi:hypothetical protein